MYAPTAQESSHVVEEFVRKMAYKDIKDAIKDIKNSSERGFTKTTIHFSLGQQARRCEALAVWLESKGYAVIAHASERATIEVGWAGVGQN